MSFASRDHEVIRLRVLEHKPHGLDVVFGVSPVPFGVWIAQVEFVELAILNLGNTVGDLAGNKL